MIILWLLLLVLSVWVAVFRYRRRRLYQLAAMIPAPKAELPLVGMLHTMAGNSESILRSLQKLSYESMEHNGILRGWLCHKLYVVHTNPMDSELLLKTCLEKDDVHRFIRKITGNGSFFAPVSIWRHRRKLLVPAFTPRILENFVKVFSEQSEKLVTLLANCAGKGRFEIWPFLSRLTMDSVCETTMGVKMNTQSNQDSPVLHAMCRLLEMLCQRICQPWLHPDWLYCMLPVFKEHEELKEVAYNFADEIIKMKREEINARNESIAASTQEYDLESYTRKTFLDVLSSPPTGEKGYTNIELREEMLSLIVAGTDTSAVTLGFTLKLLGQYPHIQDRVYQELCEVFGDSDRPLVKEDLMNLKYLERVIKESLRLFPPVPFIIRKVLEEITLPSGRILPEGSSIFVSIWGAHRDPKYWGPDAELFDPDRFLPERFKLDHPCSYIPFSYGPRNCIGYRYAMMSLKTALAAILREYKVIDFEAETSVPQIKLKVEIMIKAVDGYKLALKRRRSQVQLRRHHIFN